MNVFIMECLNNEQIVVERFFATSSGSERDEWIKSIQHASSLLKGNLTIEKSTKSIQKIVL
jgi:hypothetical protein